MIEALAIRRALLGEEHPDVAHTYHRIGEVHEARGSTTESHKYYDKALQVASRAVVEMWSG